MHEKRSCLVLALVAREAATKHMQGKTMKAVLKSAALALLAVALVQTALAHNEPAATGADLHKPPAPEVIAVNDFIYQVHGIATVSLIITDAGLVVFDTGIDLQAAEQRRRLLAKAPQRPVTHVILSHAHADHTSGTPLWLEENTRIIAHRKFPRMQDYLAAIEPFQWRRNRALFTYLPEQPRPRPKIKPDVLVGNEESYEFTQGGRRFVVLGMPGAEGDDSLTLWLPEERILLAGDALGPMFPQFPNLYTMRGEKFRDPLAYVDTLNRLIAMEPEVLVLGHFTADYASGVIRGRDRIKAGLSKIREAVSYVNDQTVAAMNAGKSVEEAMAAIELPRQLDMTQIHGYVSWAVRGLWDYYGGWFHFEKTTDLYPVPADAVYPDIAELAGTERLVERAAAFQTDGKPLHALHLVDIVLAADQRQPAALRIKREALESLLAQARSQTSNNYEIQWLQVQLQAIQRAETR